MFAVMGEYCTKKTTCVVEIKYLEEAEKEITHRPAYSELNRKKTKEEKFNTSLMKRNGQI